MLYFVVEFMMLET